MRDHTIDTSRPTTTNSRLNSTSTGARWSGKEPATCSTGTVYSTLLALRDSVCKGGSQPQGCADTVLQESTEMSLLQNEETKLRVQSSSGQQLEPQFQLTGKSEREASTGHCSTAATSESISGHVHSSNSRQLLIQGAAMATRHDTRHQAHDIHKLHDNDDGEEEEADSPPQLPG